MYTDPIVEEIHQIRENHCQQFHFDLHQIFADVKQHEQKQRGKVVNLSLTRREKPSNRFKTDENIEQREYQLSP